MDQCVAIKREGGKAYLRHSTYESGSLIKVI